MGQLPECPPLPLIDRRQWLEAWTPAQGTHELLLVHYAEHVSDFAVLDVGCQYGSSAMHIARFLRAAGINQKVHAFDCGVAGRLAPMNIVNNGFADIVDFQPFAVSSREGYLLMYSDLGHSEDNRTVNRVAESTLATSVKSVTLDGFLSRTGGQRPTVAKIDTQGAEPEVLAGFKQTMQSAPCAAILEFTPWAMRNRIDPVSILLDLMKTHTVYDVGHHHNAKARTIAPDNAAAFVTEVDESESKWTDILIVPQNLPMRDGLIRRLEG